MRGELGAGEGLWEEWVLEMVSKNRHRSNQRILFHLGIASFLYPEPECRLQVVDVILRMDSQSVCPNINRTIRIFKLEDIMSLESSTDLQEALRGLVVSLEFPR